MGRRGRRRERFKAPASTYTDPDGNELDLRSALSPLSRHQYSRIAGGQGLGPSATRDDAWQRAVEFLFERLAVGWTIHGVPLEGQRDLLARYRVASGAERAWIRETLRRHCAEHFPDLEAP